MESQAMTARLPLEVYEKLRREAFETRRPMNEIITEAVAARYQRVTAAVYGDICDVIERVYHRLPLDGEGDAYKHTSAEARAAALRIIEILGLEDRS